jgi:hypothetical protein
MDLRLKALAVAGVGLVSFLAWYVAQPLPSNQQDADGSGDSSGRTSTLSPSSPSPVGRRWEDQFNEAVDSAAENAREAAISPQRLRDQNLLAAGRRSVAEAVLFIEQNYREQGHQRALGYLMEELGKERFDIIHEIAPLLTKSGELEGPLQTISRHLVGKPLEESLRLAETLPTEMKVILMEKLVGSFVETGQVDQAKAVLARMPYSERRSRAIEEILKPLARTDPEAAVSWALALPRAEDVRGAGRQFASAISSNTNLEALQSALGKIHDVRFRAAILKQVGKLAGEQGSVASAIQALGISGTERERLVAGSIGAPRPPS